ncbi:MAG: patatin-like phospholipase family protein [Xanthomonadales bacterium]|nr:patatin-like phospholipase family protein [Xanthomonadales bacterium]
MNHPQASEHKTISLALQGGGAHGAFTWGVLDRLLEDPRISFDAISATSSGALNALALTQGWISGGREGARTCLDVLWQRIAGHPQAGAWIFGSRVHAAEPAAQNLYRYFSSRQIKPASVNPVSQIAEVMFDFEQLRAESPFPLHLAATRVRDGALILFGPERLGIDALLASTCLPQILAPICIDGEHYWDGGWAGNPALEPLLAVGRNHSILCVLVQTLKHVEVPTTPEQIATRMGELGFTSAFLRELRSLIMLREAIGESTASDQWQTHLKQLEINLLEPGEPLQNFKDKAASGSAIGFLTTLRDHGRHCAAAWLADPQRHRITRESPILRT